MCSYINSSVRRIVISNVRVLNYSMTNMMKTTVVGKLSVRRPSIACKMVLGIRRNKIRDFDQEFNLVILLTRKSLKPQW